MDQDLLLEQIAELAVGAGANLRRGQLVTVSSQPGKEDLTRAIVRAAYRRGAKYVDVFSFDPHVKRARIELGDADDLSYIPPWHRQRVREIGEAHGCRIAMSGPIEPTLFEGLDPERLGRDQFPRVPELVEVVNAATTNWTIVPCPSEGWARFVHRDLDPEDALERLRGELHRILRLDEPDPSEAWRARTQQLGETAARLTERHFDGLRFRGPGTDLRVGLLPSSKWMGGTMRTVDGIVHIPNVPTEEVFTAPDPERTEGHVTATKPLVVDGTTIEGLRVTFEGGRAVRFASDKGGEVLEAISRRDDGGRRLGEVALVDREGRIGPLGTVFYDTLLDENAASHIALGSAYAMTVGDDADQGRRNMSEIHIDFMIGSPEVDVDGVLADGSEVPVLRDGTWQV